MAADHTAGDPVTDVSDAAMSLRAVVDGVNAAPDCAADPLHLAYLRGAADALAMLAGGSPDLLETGQLQRDAGSTADARTERPENCP
jgi:hypothetical protein